MVSESDKRKLTCIRYSFFAIFFTSMFYALIIVDIIDANKLIKNLETIECNHISTINSEFGIPYMLVNVSRELYLDTEYFIYNDGFDMNLCRDCNDWYIRFEDIFDISCQSNVNTFLINVNEFDFRTDDIIHYKIGLGDIFKSIMLFLACMVLAVGVELTAYEICF